MNFLINYLLFISILLIQITGQVESQIQKNNFQSAQELVDSVEQTVLLGQKRASDLYNDKCSDTVTTCSQKIYDECGLYEPESLDIYFENFQLKDCKVKGLEYTYETVSGRCSNEEDCNNKLSKRIACSMSTLFDEDQLRQDIEGHIFSSYAGFANSFVQFYPYKHDAFECGECRDYDPRLRPWYVGAVSGAKNLILVLDVSGSMSGDKIDMAKEAAISVVDTLGHNDKFQVVLFESEGKLLKSGFTGLIDANRKNKDKVIKKLEEIEATGGTNFEDAFKKAFDVFDKSPGIECINVILFMTDGTITEGQDDFGIISQQIQSRNSSIQASIFTYSFGDEASKDLPKQIACDNLGIWYEVKDDDEDKLKSIMSHYYNYLALGFKIFDAQTEELAVIWSEIYEDSSTKQKMITASAPIYHYDEYQQKQLLGVFAIDVLESQFENFPDRSQVFDVVQKRGRTQCPTQGLSECQVEQLRDSKCNNVQDCGSSKISITLDGCSQEIKGKWQNETGKKEAEYASVCPNTDSSDFSICLEWWHWVLIILGSIIGLILIGYLIWYSAKKYRYWKFKKFQKKTAQQNQNGYGYEQTNHELQQSEKQLEQEEKQINSQEKV